MVRILSLFLRRALFAALAAHGSHLFRRLECPVPLREIGGAVEEFMGMNPIGEAESCQAW